MKLVKSVKSAARLVALAVASLCFASVAQAGDTAKAVLTDHGRTLKFVYDSENYGVKGTDWFLVTDAEDVPLGAAPWHDAADTVERVEFTQRFRKHKPDGCESWFYNFTNLTCVAGTCNLDTSEATSFRYMFSYCRKLTRLDLSQWDTSNVTDMRCMFYECSGLTTIYALDTFTTSSLGEGKGTQMFTGCTSLVGGEGRAYSEGQDGSGYARIDEKLAGGGRKYGYFTEGGTPVALVSTDGRTLTFHYDTVDYSGNGSAFRLFGWDSEHPPWEGLCSGVTQAVFSASFAAFRPHSCAHWFAGLQSCKTIVNMPEYLNTEECGSLAAMFSECSNLTSIDLSGFDTSFVTDMAAMFYRCLDLESLDVSCFDTSHVTDMHLMFSGCSQLKTVVGLEVFDTSRVTDFSGMFAGVAGKHAYYPMYLTSIDLSGFDTSNAVDMNGMFWYCWDLKSLDIGNFDTSSVTNMASMFSSCRGLTSLDVSGLDTSNVTDMSDMFSACDGLTSLDLSNFDTSRVTDMQSMFSSCENLTSLNVSSFDTSRVTNMQSMFSSCENLTSLNVSGFDTSRVTDMHSMFESCSSLTSLNVSSFNTSNVKDMNYMFRDCRSLKSLDLGSFDMRNTKYMMSFLRECISLQRVNLSCFSPGDSNEEFTSCDYMIRGCTNLTTIYVSEDFSRDGGAYWWDTRMFEGSTNLVGQCGTTYDEDHTWGSYARIDKPDSPGYFSVWMDPVAVYNAETKTLTFYHDFADHSAEGTVYSVADAEALDPSKSTSRPPWYECRNDVTNVVFDSSFANYAPRHCARWFMGFKALESITGIENLDVSCATSLHGMFNGCEALECLDLTGFDTRLVGDMDYMFSQCDSLRMIAVSDRFTTESLTSECLHMFWRCWRLRGGYGSACEETGDYDNPGTTMGAAYARIDAPYAPGYFSSPDAVAVRTDNGELVFYCDGIDHSEEGTVYRVRDAEFQDPSENPPWHGLTVSRVVFDKSFANYRPQHCGNWFRDFQRLTQVSGTQYLDVSAATSLEGMFRGCSVLTTLDIPTLDTRSIQTLKNMFYGCSALETVYVGSKFTTTAVTNLEESVFLGCTSLVGRLGWTYDPLKATAEYARVDETDARGYFGMYSPVAVLSNDGTKLSFYFDKRNHSTAGTVFSVEDAEAIDPSSEDAPWSVNNASENVTAVVFDPSFAKYRPSQCGSWFYNMQNLETVYNLGYLDVSAATNLSYMFSRCHALTVLDLSRFDTRLATTMKDMFTESPALATIYAGEGFSTASLADPEEPVFGGNTELVGGNGTAYSDGWLSAVYARIDAEGAPGYFTERESEEDVVLPERTAVAVYTRRTKTLTFYYDTVDRSTVDGGVYFVEDAEEIPGSSSTVMPWYDDCHLTVTRVVFDKSFEDYKPVNCAKWFMRFGNLTRIDGLCHLDVSNVGSMSAMFYQCLKLKEIDLTEFDTSAVKDMSFMFALCPELETVYASESFVTTAVTNLSEICFLDNYKLVGGEGTAYDSNYKSAGPAKLDGLGQNGYFSSRKPVAVLSHDGTTLTFYADGWGHEAEGKSVYSVTNADSRATSSTAPWAWGWSTVKTVVFDKSFKNYRPKHCARWFSSFSKLESVIGTRYLDISRATSLEYMFNGCTALERLGIESFDTSKVTSMYYMFNGCTGLTTIHASESFVTAALSSEERMFTGCTALVGGNGTAFASGSDTSEYARIDGSDGAGYFSAARTGVAVLSDEGHMTFYCDGKDHSAEGTVYPVARPNEYLSYMSWHGDMLGIYTVEFDPTFVDCRVQSAVDWFRNARNLVSVKGLEYLDTSEVTSMQRMFYYCENLESLDLSGFDMRNLAYKAFSFGEYHPYGGCVDMFTYCPKLTTIYATDGFDVSHMDEHEMFFMSSRLVGGNGTSYADYKRVGIRAAYVDSSEQKGYFTWLRPVAVYSETAKTLTFYYDGRDHSSEGTVYSLEKYQKTNPATAYAPWSDIAASVEHAVFDPSFAGFSPLHCAGWFDGFTTLADIEGLQYLDVSRAVNLSYMFNNCNALTALDVSGFNTALASDMEHMFSYCSALATIYASEKFVTTALSDPSSCCMFEGTSTTLVGGNGTTDAGDTAELACIDKDGQQGYFTEKIARAVLSLTDRTVTFYYDSDPHEIPSGEDAWSYLLSEDEARDPSVKPEWAQYTIYTVVIDPSFAAYSPKRCDFWFSRSTITSIEGLEYLNVSSATNLHGMFKHSTGLTELDLSGFNTANVRDMGEMFSGCTNLVTIYASTGFKTEALDIGAPTRIMFEDCEKLVGGYGCAWAELQDDSSDCARINTEDWNGYFTEKIGPIQPESLSGYAAWAADRGLTGDDALWNAKPAMWGGSWENAFIYTYGEALADGKISIMSIWFDESGAPVITTAPAIEGRDDFTSSVIGAPALDDWTAPVELEEVAQDDWMLPAGASANFFKVKMTE